MYGHGVANRYIEMVNLLALLHQPGRYVLNIIVLCLSYNYHQYNTYITSLLFLQLWFRNGKTYLPRIY